MSDGSLDTRDYSPARQSRLLPSSIPTRSRLTKILQDLGLRREIHRLNKIAIIRGSTVGEGAQKIPEQPKENGSSMALIGCMKDHSGYRHVVILSQQEVDHLQANVAMRVSQCIGWLALDLRPSSPCKTA